MADSSTLAQVASIIAAFGVTMLFFRIQRELEMRKQGEEVWIPYSDQLLIYATLLSLFLVVLPIIIAREASPTIINLTKGACGAAVIMLGGYIPGILSHYRLIWGKRLEAPRQNPEPIERIFVLASILIGIIVFVLIAFGIL